MAQPAAKKQTKDFHLVAVKGVSVKKPAPSEAFTRPSHFAEALLPMWVGVTYLFIKDMVRLSHVSLPSARAGSASHVSLDESILVQIVMLGLFYFAVGFSLLILRTIRKVAN